MRIAADPLILRHQHSALAPGGGDEDLVSGIAVERLRQVAALDENRTGELPDAQTVNRHGLVEPLFERAVEDQVSFLDLLGDLPHGDEGEPEGPVRRARS
jgi:hypothetical protein